MCGIFAAKSKSNAKSLSVHCDILQHRGPDQTNYWEQGDVFFAFHRLAIMDLSHNGDQPFHDPTSGNHLICNGEIFNYLDLKEFCAPYAFHSSSDCEVLLPLFAKYGLKGLCQKLDAEFAFVIYEESTKSLVAARDPLGIRPLFYGLTSDPDEIFFASEAKALTSLCIDIRPFPPGHFYQNKTFVPFHLHGREQTHYITCQSRSLDSIRLLLTDGVRKRLHADTPIGFLLSGGLDSSLVCALATKILGKKIRTFAVGTNTDAIDIKYANQVAKFIGSDHTDVTFTVQEAIDALKKVIWHLETWDITTIRASIGMYLVSQYISEKTDIKVLLTGEVSDELFGYKYTDYAPSAEAFQKEAQKRISELYVYDVLRADRCIAAHSLEARVPFADLSFVDLVMAIDPELKLNKHNQGKYLLRLAFSGMDLLPDEILHREKAAFSDAVGHSMVDELKKFAENSYTDQEFSNLVKNYTYCPPISKEALLYRQIFETHFPNLEKLIPSYWLPNQEWNNCNVLDPSARHLPNYGASGK